MREWRKANACRRDLQCACRCPRRFDRSQGRKKDVRGVQGEAEFDLRHLLHGDRRQFDHPDAKHAGGDPVPDPGNDHRHRGALEPAHRARRPKAGEADTRPAGRGQGTAGHGHRPVLRQRHGHLWRYRIRHERRSQHIDRKIHPGSFYRHDICLLAGDGHGAGCDPAGVHFPAPVFLRKADFPPDYACNDQRFQGVRRPDHAGDRLQNRKNKGFSNRRYDPGHDPGLADQLAVGSVDRAHALTCVGDLFRQDTTENSIAFAPIIGNQKSYSD